MNFHEVAQGPEPSIETRKLAKEKLLEYSSNMKSLNRLEDYDMCVENPRWKNNRDALFHALFYKECTEECLDCNCELIKTWKNGHSISNLYAAYNLYNTSMDNLIT